MYMTGNKRFTYENHKVKDNLTGEFHSSNMVSVNVLNSLNDENEQLKQELYHIDKLIEDLGHEEMKRQYEEICGDVE